MAKDAGSKGKHGDTRAGKSRKSAKAAISGQNRKAKKTVAKRVSPLPRTSPYSRTRAPLQAWPPAKLESHPATTFELHLVSTDRSEKKLPPLVCNAWSVVPGKEFSSYQFTAIGRADSRIKTWIDLFAGIGHHRDLLVVSSQFNYQIYRPVCTNHDGCVLTFHALHGSPVVRFA